MIKCTKGDLLPNVAEQKTVANKKAPSMTPGRAALIGLIDQYLNGLLDPSISLLEVHKLMFFLQETGEPLRLNYHKAAYGPYADNLRHVFNAIEGHFIKGYQDGGDAPDKQIELMPNVVEQASEFLQAKPATQAHFGRVAKLVEGSESAYGLELLSTVYWVVKHEGAASVEQAQEKIYNWNERKKQFSQKQIAVAYQTLHKQEWV